MDISIAYSPNNWQAPAHAADWEVACAMGGLGSGKSVWAIQELLACALENPGFTYFIGRKTLPSLRDSTLKTFRSVVPAKLIRKFNESHLEATLINDSQFIFRGMDDMEKLKSMEVAGGFINEVNELTKEMFLTFKSRVRQKVNGKPPTRYRTIIDLNPPDEDHWVPQMFLHEKPKGFKLFESSSFDNQDNLPPGYIDGLLSQYTPNEAMRMVYGKVGRIHRGKPVFGMFQRGNYIRGIQPVKEATIFRGWDFGYNRPAVVWLQFIDGQARVFAEKLGHKVYLDDFIRDEVLPYEKEIFGDLKPGLVKDFCDPRGSDESDKGKSSIDILNEHGIYPMHRRTTIKEGIKTIKGLLTTQQNGDPDFLIHHRCAILVEGFKGGYHRDQDEDDPAKDGYFEHPMDALRYALVHLVRRHKFMRASEIVNAQQVYIHPVTGRRIEI